MVAIIRSESTGSNQKIPRSGSSAVHIELAGGERSSSAAAATERSICPGPFPSPSARSTSLHPGTGALRCVGRSKTWRCPAEESNLAGAVASPLCSAHADDRCVECGKCLAVCPFDAIQPDFGTRTLNCTFCQTCGGVCPTEAIHFVPLPMNRRIGTPDSSGSARLGLACCRMDPAFRTRIGSWSQCAISGSWRLPMKHHMNSGRNMNGVSGLDFMLRPEFMWGRGHGPRAHPVSRNWRLATTTAGSDPPPRSSESCLPGRSPRVRPDSVCLRSTTACCPAAISASGCRAFGDSR